MCATPLEQGRFAPSPTGPLHFGSLVTALGSFLAVRHRGGEWQVRLEDLDTTRNVPGADAEILLTLERFSLNWDGPVLRQSQRIDAYEAALAALLARGQAYPCACSRQDLRQLAAGDAMAVYPGTCREGLPAGKPARSFRFKTSGLETVFHDELKGELRTHPEHEGGDFVIRRADGPFAYQLAVVVDDAFQGITQVVRGADLLESTPRQVALQQALGYPTPRYLHLPLVLSPSGTKLSKQTGASAVTPDAATLRAALRFLGQPEPPASLGNDMKKILMFSAEHFDCKNIITE